MHQRWPNFEGVRKAEVHAKAQGAVHAADAAKEHASETSAVVESSTAVNNSADVNSNTSGTEVKGKGKVTSSAKAGVKKH